jgi:histone acetyltransferase (RNA polymerase elongator complex component)
VRSQIDTALSTIDTSCEAEIAFFGGSFTGIDRVLMTDLLKLAYEYVSDGRVKSLRCSTRPDYIDEDILNLLKSYGVTTIELGLQSTSDHVLTLTKRGHLHFDEEKACKMIVDHGFSLVGQMMIGLPGSTLEDEINTARFIVDSGAVGARIYPTVVFYGTELCQMTSIGEYLPLELADAVERSARVLEIFLEGGVDVIRIGLCSSENLSDEEKYYAGPNHPALGEMVESAMIYNKITRLIDTAISHRGSVLRIFVGKGFMSKATGQKKTNKYRLIREFGFADVKITEDPDLSGYQLRIEEERKRECT